MKETKNEIKETVNELKEKSRAIVTPEYAEKIARVFGFKLPEKLIRTAEQFKRQRAYSSGSGVSIPELSLWLCDKLKIKPDAELISLSRRFYGSGRIADAETNAGLKAISEKFNLKFEV